MRFACIVALASSIAGAGSSVAQDSQTFVVEGPGRTNCADFIKQNPSGDSRSLIAAWLTGYLTAHHRLIPDVFDLSPWQSPSLMLSLLDQYCTANPDQIVERGAQELVAYFVPSALTEPAEVVAVESEGNGVLIYVPVLAEVRAALAEAGYPSGADVVEIIQALRDYQSANKLGVTGLPDQATLARLLQ